jgi:2-dehydro-3-deoxyphosphogluconate aldolase / (4S)-4-hydroxy-2-oxoglutarate aldolase
MASNQVLERVAEGRVIAILRGDYRGAEQEILDALVDAGILAVEVTMNSPGALGSIRLMADYARGRIAVGAGTVLRVAEVDEAADSGAMFIVSPNRDVRVIGHTKLRGLASFPGCFTPSEIVEAFEAGADAAKLFPASSLEPRMVADLRAPLGDVRLVPTGGVDPDRARAYLKAGAWAVGVGSPLANADTMRQGGIERLATRAREFAAALRLPE